MTQHGIFARVLPTYCLFYTGSITNVIVVYSPPKRCPDPLVLHESGSGPRDEAPVLLPDELLSDAGLTAVPYARWYTRGVPIRRDMKAGVGSKFGPPPNSGYSLVRKSCRWAAMRPVSWTIIVMTPPGKRRLTRIMQWGTSWAGIVKKMKLAFIPRWSCVTVYAMATIRAERNDVEKAKNMTLSVCYHSQQLSSIRYAH
jgi:hypothetical protein